MRWLLVLLIVGCLCSVAFRVQAETAQGVARYALIVGANDGGGTRITLRYAADDAKNVAMVLEDLGGISPKRRILLMDPEKEEFSQALDRIKLWLSEENTPGIRKEFFFYYSGHSDENGLLLYDRAVGYQELKARIKALNADVKIVILDSCQSGALTRQKGGKKLAPFLSDSSVQLKGHAYLTSSAADEAAQESDRIGGSFFTHYLVSGLRGAADASKDGRVSLNEAYHYTFNETLGRTETTQSGAQHASYEISLSGTGDLVLTELGDLTSGLTFAPELQGRLYVRDGQNRLVAEVNNQPDSNASLALEPGDYRVVLDQDGSFYMAEIHINTAERPMLSLTDFNTVDAESTVARGLGKKEKDYTRVPFNIGLFPPAHVNKAFDRPIINNVNLGLFAAETDRLDGISLSVGLNWQGEDINGAQMAFLGNVTEQDATGAQGAYILNYVGRDAVGAVAGGIYNHVGRHFTGAEAALVNYTGGNSIGAEFGLVNISVGNFTGAQIALVNTTIDDATGAQFGLANVTTGDFVGAQWTLANVTTGDVVGAQFSLANISTGSFEGAQFGLANVAGEALHGAQFGLANIHTGREEINSGGQFGLVNISSGEMEGVQIGLFNYSKYVDVPIGLFSIVEEGPFHGVFWTSDTSLVNAGFKIGSKYIYNIVSAGVQPITHRSLPTFSYGIGGHIPLVEDWTLDLDYLTQVHINPENYRETTTMGKLRLGFLWDVDPSFALLFGPSLNFYSLERNRELRPESLSYIPAYRVGSFSFKPGDEEKRQHFVTYLGPGFQVGFQI